MSAEEAPLVAVWLTWREAPSALRARLGAPLDTAQVASLRAQGVEGVVEVHTCARSLWVAAARDGEWAGALLQSLVAARADGAVLPMVMCGLDAARYVLRVAVGLDSYVQGEADIGGQVLAAFDAAREGGRSAGALNLLQQAAARLVAEGRDQGFIRPNRGLGALAVSALVSRGVDLSVPVAVVGAGAIGARVVGALGRAGAAPPVYYNRTPRPDTRPLDAVGKGRHRAAVVCTAGPERWFQPPRGLDWVIDLGMPAQVRAAPNVVELDVLLAGDPQRLPDDRVRAAELAVEREIGGLCARVRAARWQRGLQGAVALRDAFVGEELDRCLAEALDDLPEEQRRRVRAAAEAALRRYNHRMLTWIKRELDPAALDVAAAAREGEGM
jgi:glutamyl-tRNA reductase